MSTTLSLEILMTGVTGNVVVHDNHSNVGDALVTLFVCKIGVTAGVTGGHRAAQRVTVTTSGYVIP